MICPASPTFSLNTGYYFLFVLAVTINSLLMIVIGGKLKERMQKGGLRFQFANKSKFRKKFWGFILFIVGIFLLGWMGSKLQNLIYQYLCKNVATNIIGVIIAIAVAWLLYDWLVWRKNRDD